MKKKHFLSTLILLAGLSFFAASSVQAITLTIGFPFNYIYTAKSGDIEPKSFGQPSGYYAHFALGYLGGGLSQFKQDISVSTPTKTYFTNTVNFYDALLQFNFERITLVAGGGYGSFQLECASTACSTAFEDITDGTASQTFFQVGVPLDFFDIHMNFARVLGTGKLASKSSTEHVNFNIHGIMFSTGFSLFF